MRIRPTELGWKGLLLLLALECAFLATAYSNLFFLLIAFCVALGSLGCLWTWSNLRGLRVLRVEIPHAAAGATRVVRCELQARRPRCDLQIELLVDDGPIAVGSAAAVAAASLVTGSLPGRSRGITKVHAVRVSSRFPLGLFQARVDLPIAAEIVTYPAVLPANATANAAQAGQASSHRVSRSATAHALRAFHTGDSPSDVHWKATARRGQPVVKEREREGDAAVAIVLDRRCDEAALEPALRTAATLLLQARARGSSLRLVSQDATFSCGQDPGVATQALRWLAGTTPLPAGADAPKRIAGAMQLPTRHGEEVAP